MKWWTAIQLRLGTSSLIHLHPYSVILDPWHDSMIHLAVPCLPSVFPTSTIIHFCVICSPGPLFTVHPFYLTNLTKHSFLNLDLVQFRTVEKMGSILIWGMLFTGPQVSCNFQLISINKGTVNMMSLGRYCLFFDDK